jgi:hypothetical protein
LTTCRGFAAASNGSDAKTCVVVVSVEIGGIPGLACWAPSKIAGNANEAPTAPASNTSANARLATTLMGTPLPADILSRKGLRQSAAEA